MVPQFDIIFLEGFTNLMDPPTHLSPVDIGEGIPLGSIHI